MSVRGAGVLLFRPVADAPGVPAGAWEFLLLKHRRRWDLPKGHCEHGELDRETAIRELHEETGFPPRDIRLLDGFEHKVHYETRYRRYGDRPVAKTVVVFLGWTTSRHQVHTTEHGGYEWFRWRPPHAVQELMIDPLLTEVARHFDDPNPNPPHALHQHSRT